MTAPARVRSAPRAPTGGRPPGRRRLRAFLLKYWEAGGGGRQPYRIDTLADAGVDLDTSDAMYRRPWTLRPVHHPVRRLERLGMPFLQTVLATRRIARADAVIAVFESQGNALAALRALRVWPFTRPRYAVVACWLAEDAPRFGGWRRRWYRWAYGGVDRVVHFSRNQRAVFRDLLGIPDERLAYVPFGVDHERFAPAAPAGSGDRGPLGDEDGGYVLAVGRDRGRDWATLFDAVRGTDLAVKVACRPEDLSGLDVPPNVEVLGYVGPDAYRELTARARVVTVPTRVLAYPTGQSVALEAMAMARCCVVTDTPAMRDYLNDDVDALLVPPGDAAALRAALERAAGDGDLRRRIGTAARAAVERTFNARAMWAAVAAVLDPASGSTEGAR